MGCIELSLFKHPSGVAFDPEKVIAQAKTAFPDAAFLSDDQAAAEAERAEAFLAKELQADPQGPASKVVGSLWRKARSYGPSYVFSIPLQPSGTIRGLARCVDVRFLHEETVPEPIRHRLIEFLKSLGVGYLRASTTERNRMEILADLWGPSDYLSRQSEVPWKRELESVSV